MVDALNSGGDFENAGHVGVTNIDTAAKALVVNQNSAVDDYSLATNFAGGTVSVAKPLQYLPRKTQTPLPGNNHSP